MVALWVTLAVFLAIYILMLFPVRITANLCQEPEFVVRYLFLRFKIHPKKAKKVKQPKKEKSQASLKDDKAKPKKHHGVSYYVNKYGDLLKAVLKAAGKLLKSLVIKRLAVNIVVGSDDAAQTAVEYGAVCAVVYPVVSMIESSLMVKRTEINVNADFDATSARGELYVDMRIRVLRVLVIAAGLLKQLVKYVLK